MKKHEPTIQEKLFEGLLSSAVLAITGDEWTTKKHWEESVKFVFSDEVAKLVKDSELPIDMVNLKLRVIARLIKKIEKESGGERIEYFRKFLQRGLSKNSKRVREPAPDKQVSA